MERVLKIPLSSMWNTVVSTLLKWQSAGGCVVRSAYFCTRLIPGSVGLLSAVL